MVRLPEQNYKKEAPQRRFADTLLEKTRNIAGVDSAPRPYRSPASRRW